MNLPVVGARRKPDIGDKGKAADRVFMPGKRSYGLVLLPELDGLVRRAFIPNISEVGIGKAQHILTSDELFPVDGHNSQNRLSVTFQVVRQTEVLPHLGRAVELLLSNFDRSSHLMTYLSHDPEIMVPSEAVCNAQTLCSCPIKVYTGSSCGESNR